MNNWLVIAIVVVIVLFLIGGLSTVHKSAKTPLRKKGLNDLKETLPRKNSDKNSIDTIRK